MDGQFVLQLRGGRGRADHEAREVVGSVRATIARWHHSVVLLRSLKSRLARQRDSSNDWARDVESLLDEILAESDAFEKQVAGLPDTIASSGAIVDARRAMLNLTSALDQLWVTN